MAYDFSKMSYDVSRIPEKTPVIEFYPILSEYSEFGDKRNDQLLRIAFLATDQDSPFVKVEREDYEKRLQKIFEHLKIRNNKLLSDLVLGINKDFENMVNRIYMNSDNLAYVMWADKLRMFHYIGLSLRQPPKLDNMDVDMSKRAALDIKRTAIYNDLVEYESQVFTDIPTRNKIRKQITKLLQPAENYAQEKQVV